MPEFLHALKCAMAASAAMLILATDGRGQSDGVADGPALEPFVAKTRHGEVAGQRGSITVPERRDRPDGPTIELAFAVYPARTATPGLPIVFLAGGPGAPGIDLGAEAALDPAFPLLGHHPVIAIDQRGTGRSRPNLEKAPRFGWELPADQPVTRAALIAAAQTATRQCVAHWREQGVDLDAYNSVESAADVDAVRAALGHERVIVWGTSYGSHLGLAYLRHHGAHAAAAVLMRVEEPDATFKLPSTVQTMLERLERRVAGDPNMRGKFPAGLCGELQKVLDGLRSKPVKVAMERGGQKLALTLGPLDVQAALARALGHAPNQVGMPMAIYMMTQGEFRHMLGFAMRLRRGEVGSAMTLAMDCASWASDGRLATIERERQDPANLLSDAIHAPWYPDTCSACESGRLGQEFREPFACDVPTLFVSGALDARTPAANVAAIQAGFSNHAHVVIAATGHETREYESEEYCSLLRRFLAGETVASTTIALEPLPLRPIRER
ncbi:MAG: alpha/beta fold hydrolase [bacterium]|nr:alpha/beta fold hydrolase [bacterium]